MARIRGVEGSEAGLVTRFLYWMTKRKVGRVILPFKITAHQPRLLFAVGGMEVGQQALKTFNAKLTVGRNQSRNAGWLPVLNRYRICRGQNSRRHRRAVDGVA